MEPAKGQTTGEVCRKSGITEQIYCRWWKEYGSLRVDQVRRLKELERENGRLWLNDGSCLRLRPCWPDHVWAYDFVADRTRDGRPLKMFTVVDEYTLECLAIDVERQSYAMSVLERLAALFVERGVVKTLCI